MNRSTAMDGLRSCFTDAGVTDEQVLKHCLGLATVSTVSGSTRIAKLAEHTILLCIDTEHYTLNSDEMTELGMGVLRRQNAIKVTQSRNLGEHGDKIMRQAKWNLLRFIEHTHMPTVNPASRGAEGNRFGEARFVTFAQTRQILSKLFQEPITSDPALQGEFCPIVILGHSAGHDMSHLMGKDLAFDTERMGTVVRVIDTQKIVCETQTWGSNDKIGLATLVEKLEFEHSDSHTAANDAARTFMAAVQLVIPSIYKENCTRSMRRVAGEYEKFTQDDFVSLGGFRLYCGRCGSHYHKSLNCTVLIDPPCSECTARNLFTRATQHVTKHCTVVRDEVALERRRWYEGARKAGQVPREPFMSHLQTFAENAPPQESITNRELVQRGLWYANQDELPNNEFIPFTFEGRSFEAKRPHLVKRD